MGYTKAQLADYWKNVKSGSVLGGAAPDAFKGSTTFTGSQKSDLQNIRDTSYMDRQAAMDFANKYNIDPKQVASLSTRLGDVLDSNSPYLQRARTKATEAAGARGLLNSSMAAGAAEGAAIDRGLEVAKGDVEVDKFNVGADTDAQSLRYKAATDIAGKTQGFLNDLGGAEANYIFDVGLADEKQKDALEVMDKEYLYKQKLQNSAHAQKMETDMLQYTNQRAMEMLKQQSGLYAAYLEAYGQIAMSDISAADKNNQLVKLGAQITNAVKAAEDYKDIKISGVKNFNITGI